MKWLPKGTVLKLGTGGKAVAVKTALVTEKAESAATTLKIKSGSLYQVGDSIAGKKISAIKTDNGIDTLTIAALGAAIEANAVVTDYDKDKDTILGLSYDTRDLDKDVAVFVEPTLQVMEVEEATLPYPINADIKAGLNANGVALFKIQ